MKSYGEVRCLADGSPAIWTDERVERMRTMWVSGHSASQIAMALGGITRNAVISKVHRTGLAGRAASSLGGKPYHRKKPSAPKLKIVSPAIIADKAARKALPIHALIRVAQIALEPLVQPDGSTLGVLSLEASHCRYPCGDTQAKNFAFCGRPKEGEGPYCVDHRAICAQPINDRIDKKMRATALRLAR